MANLRLASKVAEWNDAGRPPQEAFDWSRSRNNWSRDIPSLSQFINSLPLALSRSDVRSICDQRHCSVPEKFISSMIWGYGDLGYGSYRVKKMFATPGFSEKIHKSFELARAGYVVEAYEFLSRNKVQQLGPAFASKWLSFASSGAQPSPIYDSFISMWVKKYAAKEFAKVSTSSEVWNKKTYSTYLEWMGLNSIELKVKADDLELVIFQDATQEFASKGG
jgi:hypothetical protein